VKARSASAEDARRHLESVGLRVADTQVSDLNDFATALNDGLAVGEFAPKGKAAREIRALGKEVEALLS
jgi:cellulose biosynthesis protein BcsQ